MRPRARSCDTRQIWKPVPINEEEKTPIKVRQACVISQVLLMVLFVFNPIGRAYGTEQSNIVFLEPIDAKASNMHFPAGIVIINPPVKGYTLSSVIIFCPSSSIDDKEIFAAMSSSIRGDDKLSKRIGVWILRSFVWQFIGKRFSFYAQSGDEGGASTRINGRPFNSLLIGGISWPISFNHDPRSFKIGELAGGKPLERSKYRVSNANNKQTAPNQHRWRIPGFLAGVVLFGSGFYLIFYGAYYFEYLSLKRRGLFWLFWGALLYFLGGCLMFIGPYVF